MPSKHENKQILNTKLQLIDDSVPKYLRTLTTKLNSFFFTYDTQFPFARLRWSPAFLWQRLPKPFPTHKPDHWLSQKKMTRIPLRGRIWQTFCVPSDLWCCLAIWIRLGKVGWKVESFCPLIRTAPFPGFWLFLTFGMPIIQNYEFHLLICKLISLYIF